MKHYYEREELDKLKASIDLVSYAESLGIELRCAGSQYRAHCPLHSDNTPSFYVSGDSYHCYGCGQRGDIYSLTKELFNLEFPEAVERVKMYASSGVSSSNKIRTCPEKKKLTDADQLLLEDVVGHYHILLKGSSVAQKYLAQRKISESVIEKFQIGYAVGYLSKSFSGSREQLERIGLVSAKGADTFFKRMTVPAGNTQLYGRSVVDGCANKHKYLPFTHSSVLGPLESSKIIICESIIDALTLHSHGLENAVSVYSASGMRPRFVEQIVNAGVREAVIAYDADKAGDQGAAECAKVLGGRGVSVYRMELPRGMDVNGLAVESGRPGNELWEQYRDAKHM